MRRTIPLIALLLLVVVACGDDDATTTTSATTTTAAPVTTSTPGPATTTTTDAAVDIAVSVVGGTVSVTVEGIPISGRVQIATGTAIRLTVSSDTSDEVHLHGYDLTADVGPGTPAVIEFSADIPGIFEAEFEDAHRLLVELQIS